MCPLAQKGKHILVHWVYYPDSYDCWVPASEVGGTPEPVAEPPKRWMVSNIALGCNGFNQWQEQRVWYQMCSLKVKLKNGQKSTNELYIRPNGHLKNSPIIFSPLGSFRFVCFKFLGPISVTT